MQIFKSPVFDTQQKEENYLLKLTQMKPSERWLYLHQLNQRLKSFILMDKTMHFDKDYLDFLHLLERFEVKYLIIGGFAVAVHGYVRATGDIDIWIKPEEENALKMLKVMLLFGYLQDDLTVDDFTKVPNVLMFGNAEINLLTAPDGLVDFETAYANKLAIPQDDKTFYFIGLDDLIQNKITVGRMKDLEDVRQLQMMHNLTNK